MGVTTRKLEDRARAEELRTILPLRSGIPSQDTYLRAVAAMKPEPFREAFMLKVNQPTLQEEVRAAFGEARDPRRRAMEETPFLDFFRGLLKMG